MNLTLYRDSKGPVSTIGRLCIGENLTEFLFCYTVEDEQRTQKVAGHTRIPAGRYEIKLKRGTPMSNRYDNTHSDIEHDGMLWLQEVPNFENVYIHIGNNHDDSAGCILLNYTCYIDPIDGGGSGGRSVQAYKALYKKVYPVFEMGEAVYITIKNEGVK